MFDANPMTGSGSLRILIVLDKAALTLQLSRGCSPGHRYSPVSPTLDSYLSASSSEGKLSSPHSCSTSRPLSDTVPTSRNNRRPCFILSATMLCAGCIWAALSGTSFDSHLGARILMGFAAGATESTLPLILSDYTFVHERAKVFGLYSFVSGL